MVRRFLIGLVGAVLATQAHAVTIGGLYDVDPTKSVSALTDRTGSFSQNTNTGLYPQLNALDNNWNGVWNGNTTLDGRVNFIGPPETSSLKATFLNPLINVPGVFDLYVFETGDTPTLPLTPLNPQIDYLQASLTGIGGWFDLDVIDFLAANEVGGNREDIGVYVLALDLSTLGVADGASITSLFFRNSSTGISSRTPDVLYAAGVSAVPLPGALPLFGGGLGLMSLAGWWKRRRAAVV